MYVHRGLNRPEKKSLEYFRNNLLNIYLIYLNIYFPLNSYTRTFLLQKTVRCRGTFTKRANLKTAVLLKRIGRMKMLYKY